MADDTSPASQPSQPASLDAATQQAAAAVALQLTAEQQATQVVAAVDQNKTVDPTLASKTEQVSASTEGQKKQSDQTATQNKAQDKQTKPPEPPTTTDERLWGALSYIPMVALISLLMKPTSAFVKLHARQGLTIFVTFFLTIFLYIILPPLGPLLGGLVQMALFVVGIYSLYMAFTGNWWKIPFINEISEKLPVDLFTKVTREAITGQPPVEVPPAEPTASSPTENTSAPVQNTSVNPQNPSVKQ